MHCQEGVLTAALLQDAIINHLRLYKLAYGALGWVFKHHVALHLAPQLSHTGLLIALFTSERRHKIVKRHVHNRRPKPCV